jgi:hypothetical protein
MRLRRRIERLEQVVDPAVPEGMVWRPTLLATLKALNAREKGEPFEPGEPPGPDWQLVRREEWERTWCGRPGET